MHRWCYGKIAKVKFSKINIIYNPLSSRDSKTLALGLQTRLQKAITDTEINCIPTDHPGHARELARETALNEDRPLIVSASGDGGYNEVINGVMDAGKTRAVCAVLPAGNANDHSRAIQKQPLHKAIAKGSLRHIDLLRVTITHPDQDPLVHYAHSYAGLGLTPAMAEMLKDYKQKFAKEFLQIVKMYPKTESIKIKHLGKELELDNLLFANTYQMAKVLTLSPKTLPNDGMFEVISFPSNHKIKMAQNIVKAAVSKLKVIQSQRVYRFILLHDARMQFDGELIEIKQGSKIVVESAYRALTTIV